MRRSMKLFILFLVLSLVGCGFSVTQTPLKLNPPSTDPIPRKVFSGADWQVSVEDDGWVRDTSSNSALALLNRNQRVVLFLDRDVDFNNLDVYAVKQEADFRDNIDFQKESMLVAGFNGYKYTMTNGKQTMWSWATVAYGNGYFLSCGTSTAKANVNQEVCNDIVKHFLVVKK